MKGFDPYDALTGTRVPAWVRARPRARQTAIQIRKRCPLDLAPLLGVQPLLMAKALGCFLTAEARHHLAGPAHTPNRGQEARSLVEQLDKSAGNCGHGSWGYEFDVQTRWAYYAAGTPNLIATFFVGRGFAEAGAAFEDQEWSIRARLAAGYIFDSLRRDTAEGLPFFAYTPDTSRLVHNANLLGAGLVASMGTLHGVPEWRAKALESAETTLADQRPDGSWPYGEGHGLGWSDNFHTAYNLDGLLLLWLATRSPAIREGLERGLKHWMEDFFGPAGEPKYYPNKSFPYDIHSAATAVDVAARLATWGFPTGNLARRVADWTSKNLIDSKTGLTYYQKHRLFVDKRNFIRWGEAHWALARSSLALLEAGLRSPLESALEAKHL